MNKALFLDRDGIINVDHGYVYKQSEFEFVPGIFDLCRHAIVNDYIIIVITNQSGIGRGKYSELAFTQLTSWMIAEFSKQKVKITDVYFCPHHPTEGLGQYLTQCECRKPAPGMIFQAAKQYAIELQQSVFIGDKISDMQAANAAGINQCLLLTSQYIAKTDFSIQQIDNIGQAKNYIS